MTHLLQVMLVDEFKGQKVQDVKKRIQKLMLDKVCESVHPAAPELCVCPFHRAELPEKPLVRFCSPQGALGHCREGEGPGVLGLGGLSCLVRVLLFSALFCHLP